MTKRRSAEEEQSFIELLSGHESLINRVIALYATDSEGRRDLFQEIVYQLWRSYGSFKGESSVSTWLYRVALNTAITSLRKRRRAPTETELDDQIVATTRSIDSPDKSERVQQLYSAIRKLSEVDRALIMLYLEDLSYNEIAEVTGLTEDNVGVKLNRIKSKLRMFVGAD